MLHHALSSVEERMSMIEKSQWGEGLSREDMERFAQYLYVARAEPDEPIFNEGAIEPYMCFVADGLVKVTKGDSKKNVKTICEIGPGRTVGEMSIIDGLPRSASAVAVDETTVLVLTKENFELLLDDNPKLGVALFRRLAQMISHRLRVSDWMLVEYIYES
ncbi:MAG: cyclic nucleotide-binding domain-containing protein [Syntrophorhabdus sp.]|jgi:CRP/FNR family cyclic AMP-dependent transcriptional regulator|nr:cyclic nucleotide-binding domain-containing protein [Syntrophorhabdus sp.]